MMRTSKLSLRRAVARRLLAGAAAIVAAMAALPAWAANPPFAIVGPTEWDLPIVPSANVFIQTFYAQNSDVAYGRDGKQIAGPETHTFAGLSRWAHLFSFKSLPHVGFFWEYLQPEVDLQPSGNSNSVTGLGDPLFDFAAYVKPTSSFTIGYQNILSVPIGNNNLSNHAWIEFPTMIFDWHPSGPHWYDRFGDDGTAGAGIFSTIHDTNCAGVGQDCNVGDTYFLQDSVRYQLTSWFAPFVDDIYQGQSSGRTTVTHSRIFGNYENDIGGGAKFNFTANRWLALWYLTSTGGNNTVKTKAIYLRFVNIF